MAEGGGQGHFLSHLVGRAEGRVAELADLPDVFPGNHPSPPESPTYHAIRVQAQRWWALCFAAGGGDTEVVEIRWDCLSVISVYHIQCPSPPGCWSSLWQAYNAKQNQFFKSVPGLNYSPRMSNSLYTVATCNSLWSYYWKLNPLSI